MADNKVNMSLDDIIKLNKKNKQTSFPQKGAQRGGARAGRGRGGARGGRGGNTNVRSGSKFTSPRKATLAQKRVVNKLVARKGAVNEQTKKLVNQLVKKALKTRLGRSAVNRPLATTRAVRVGRGALVGRLNRANGGLNRVAARSRVIAKNRAPITSPITATVQRRGRGRNVRALYQDEVVRPVIVQQRPRPVVIERVVESRPRVIQRVVQRPRQQRVVVQRQPARQRVIQRPQAQRVIVVERSAPRIQRIQRTQIVRQRPQRNVEYVQARNNKNNSFRNALGIGSSNRRFETVQRFEPSTTFITRKVVRRGRGFAE